MSRYAITKQEILIGFLEMAKKNILIISAQRGARTHDPEIKSLMLYRLS